MAAKSKTDKKKSKVTAADLRAMSLEELQKKLGEEQETLMRDRFRHAAAALENTAQLKTRRRLIARIETVINEKDRRA